MDFKFKAGDRVTLNLSALKNAMAAGLLEKDSIIGKLLLTEPCPEKLKQVFTIGRILRNCKPCIYTLKEAPDLGSFSETELISHKEKSECGAIERLNAKWIKCPTCGCPVFSCKVKENETPPDDLIHTCIQCGAEYGTMEFVNLTKI